MSEETLVPENEISPETVQTDEGRTEFTTTEQGVSADSQPWYSNLNIDLNKIDESERDETKSKIFNVLNKFNSPEDLVKSYAELESSYTKFSQKGAPQEYAIPSEDEVGFVIDDNDEAFRNFKEYAKESNLSQEAFSNLIKIYADTKLKEIPDMKAEMQKLGPNAEMEAQILAQWADNHFEPEDVEMMRQFTTTADRFRWMQKVRNLVLNAEKTVPNQVEASDYAAGPSTMDEIANNEIMHNYDRYVNDPIYRKHVIRKMAEAGS